MTESRDGDTAATDWMVAARSRPGSLLDYEQTLLDGLADYGEPARLSVLAAEFSLVLSKVRAELIREATRRGWLWHWHHGQRTPEGEEVVRQLRAFRGLESWSRTEPRPRRPDEEIPFPKDEWRGMSLDFAAAWEMGL